MPGPPIQKIDLKKYKRLAKRSKKQLQTEIYGILREIVMKRDGAKCLRCGKTDRLQLSHIYPRGKYKLMALEPLNLKMLCVGCHLFWWHKSPIEAWEWLRDVMPKERLDWLKVMSQSYGKLPDLNLLKIALTEDLKNLSTR
jgi:hypothetical protein